MANRGGDSSDQEGNKKKNEGKRVGNTCAACKHLEKMCNEGECEFAPHFPADRMKDFIAVQRVFGISKVGKMLKGTDPVRGAEMAKSLIWEANCWKNDPVHGPLGYQNRLVRNLENQISNKDQEIQLLRDLVKEQQRRRQQQPVLLPLLPSDGDGRMGGHHHQDHHRHFENQISNKDQEIQLLTDKFKLLQQQPINIDSNVGLTPHHHHLQGDHWAPMLFQENAIFQSGYMPPHHHLQEDHRAPMLFQENATFQGGYNVASSSTLPPPATAYNQNPVVVQDLSHRFQDQGNIGRNIGVGGLGSDNFLQGSGGSAGAAAVDNINNNNRGGICLDKDGNVDENPSGPESGQYTSKKPWRDLFP